MHATDIPNYYDGKVFLDFIVTRTWLLNIFNLIPGGINAIIE